MLTYRFRRDRLVCLSICLLFLADTAIAVPRRLEGPNPCSGEKRYESEPIGTYEASDPSLAPYDPCYDGLDNEGIQDGTDWVDANGDGVNDPGGDPQCVRPGQPMVDEDGTNLTLTRTRVRVYAEQPVTVTEDGVSRTVCDEYLETTTDTTTRYSGCFAPETAIVMADGSKQPIYRIHQGDLVLNPVTGKSSRVIMVVAGPETGPTIELGIAGRAPIQVTSDHAMLVERTAASLQPASLRSDGGRPDYQVKRAGDVSLGDRIMVADGTYQEVTTARQLPPNPKLMVFNLMLEGSAAEARQHMVLTGAGIVTGDLGIQVQLGGKIRGAIPK